MSRKKPTVLLESVDNHTGKSTQILQTDTLHIVLYQGKPFNLKLVNTMYDYPGPKYKKTAFASPAHANNLAKKMNDLYGSDEFTVVEFG